jgi:ferrous iron transport protein B
MDQVEYFSIDYGEAIEAELRKLATTIRNVPTLRETFDSRWLAVRLLESEADIGELVAAHPGGERVLQIAQQSRRKLAEGAPHGVDIALADQRYEFISQVLGQALKKPHEPSGSVAERVDGLLTNPLIGVPIFFVVMYFVFNFVVNVSAPYLDWIDAVITGAVSRWIHAGLLLVQAPDWLQGLLLDGVIAGVGGVLVFLPGLVVLFLFIALMEDSGYLARVAVVMDRFLNYIGLNGKSFVPMILGFGCAVPAIYATRTLESRRERILTSLLVPLMSCAARLPVYVVFALAFFNQRADLVIWGLYALGILVAGLIGWLFTRTLFKKSSSEKFFVMELPPYRTPTLRGLWIHISQRVGDFIRNAGTLILAAAVVVWLLLNLPLGVQDLRESYFGQLSATFAPVMEPAGFGTWEATGSLMTGLVAKEVVISTMSQIYVGEVLTSEEAPTSTFGEDLIGIGSGFFQATVEAAKAMLETLTPGITLFHEPESDEAAISLAMNLQTAFSPLSALAFMVFVLLYVPCIATLGAIRAEFGARWAAFSASYQIAIAWLLAVTVFQVGSLIA